VQVTSLFPNKSVTDKCLVGNLTFQETYHWFKVTVVYLFFLLAAATTLTIITQLICAGYTKYGKLIVIDVYELQSTSFSACSHITISSSCGRQRTFAVHG